jgi:hypothetical protein
VGLAAVLGVLLCCGTDGLAGMPSPLPGGWTADSELNVPVYSAQGTSNPEFFD